MTKLAGEYTLSDIQKITQQVFDISKSRSYNNGNERIFTPFPDFKTDRSYDYKFIGLLNEWNGEHCFGAYLSLPTIETTFENDITDYNLRPVDERMRQSAFFVWLETMKYLHKTRKLKNVMSDEHFRMLEDVGCWSYWRKIQDELL